MKICKNCKHKNYKNRQFPYGEVVKCKKCGKFVGRVLSSNDKDALGGNSE